MKSFDIAFLRSFVAVADTGTMRAAGAQRARSTAAISQQVRALETLAGAPLFERARGRVVLSARGRALLPYAREMIRLNDEALVALDAGVTGAVRFGMPQDFAQSALAEALAAFVRDHPGVSVQAHLERNSVVARRLEQGELDLAVLIGREPQPGGIALATQAARWLARENFAVAQGEPLPLLLLEEPCVFRDFALAALRDAGLPYRIVFTSPSVAGLWPAVLAGVGVTVRMEFGAPPGVVPLEIGGVAPMPRVHLTLHQRTQGGGNRAADRLASLLLQQRL